MKKTKESNTIIEEDFSAVIDAVNEVYRNAEARAAKYMELNTWFYVLDSIHSKVISIFENNPTKVDEEYLCSLFDAEGYAVKYMLGYPDECLISNCEEWNNKNSDLRRIWDLDPCDECLILETIIICVFDKRDEILQNYSPISSYYLSRIEDAINLVEERAEEFLNEHEYSLE